MTSDSSTDVLKRIRQHGHWCLRLVPPSMRERFRLPSDCYEAAQKSAVALRGWDYPHIQGPSDLRYGISRPLNNGWELFVDFNQHLEIWRLMQSGQFIHYLALWEDLEPPQLGQSAGERVLHFEAAIYTLTEVVEFCRRLTALADYGPAVRLDVSLIGTNGRRIAASPRRWLRHGYVCQTAGIDLSLEIDIGDLALRPAEIAADVAERLLDRFGFRVAPKIVRDIQDQILRNRG